MRILTFLSALVLAAASLLACSWDTQAGSAEPRPNPSDARPNVVFLLSDDQAASTLARMPAVREQLQERGRTFANTVNTMPLCCPARATILSGKYAHNHGVWGNEAPAGGWPLFRDDEADTYATRLQGAGYETAYLGRYLHAYDGSEVPPGWDRFNVEVWDGPATRMPRRFVNREGKVSDLRIPPGETQDSVVSDRAVNFVRKAALGGPFMLSVGFEAPHTPGWHEDRFDDEFRGLGVPRTPAYNEADVSDKPPYVSGQRPLRAQTNPQAGTHCAKTYNRAPGQNDCLYRNQLRALATVDAAVGRIVAALRASGELDNTFIVYATDNGLHLGEHRLAYGKLTPYATDTGFPLIARGPGVPTGTTSGRLVGTHDIAPTLAEIGGAPPPDADGRSILPVLRETGEARVASWRAAVLAERNPVPGAIEKGGPRSVPGWYALRTENGSYVEWDSGAREYYDLAQDPHQLDNAYGLLPEQKKAELSTRLDALKSCDGRGCWAAEGP